MLDFFQARTNELEPAAIPSAGAPINERRSATALADSLLILSLHGIGTPPAGIPEDERPYWMPEGQFNAFISSASAEARALGVSLMMTFDDGNRSDRDIGAPALASHGIPGAFFPCTGRFGQPGYLDAEDVRALRDQGFQIGSHGIDHVPWTSLDAAALRRNVSESKRALEALLGVTVVLAAPPFGAYNRRVLAAVRDAGYSAVYSCDAGLSEPGDWLCRRWYYHVDMPFDVAFFVATSRSRRHRWITGAKQIIKSLR